MTVLVTPFTVIVPLDKTVPSCLTVPVCTTVPEWATLPVWVIVPALFTVPLTSMHPPTSTRPPTSRISPSILPPDGARLRRVTVTVRLPPTSMMTVPSIRPISATRSAVFSNSAAAPSVVEALMEALAPSLSDPAMCATAFAAAPSGGVAGLAASFASKSAIFASNAAFLHPASTTPNTTTINTFTLFMTQLLRNVKNYPLTANICGFSSCVYYSIVKPCCQ